MKVSKELIEKYHEGKCSPEESTLVENWLLDDDETTYVFPELSASKEEIRLEIWGDIKSVLPSEIKKSESRVFQVRSVQWAAAASIAVFILAFISLNRTDKSHYSRTNISSVNRSESLNREILSDDFTISLGPQSNVRINPGTGLVDFCGTLKISPKKDMSLSFNDVCTDTKGNTEKMSFKKGETYIALNYRHEKTNEVIVMEEKLLMGLPPVLKRQIMDQFNI
ncbi:hypothetical protein DYBT9275_03137 [Dyadobacter sp. CECT 9275]|uniref:Uncharacterized protein n=1 Tax=Dyadobacter helix TaxID=2822344 RepID=A0A916JC43_9BACT|nr:hypothetical protein [Dyadobacter sp. CECT 9275]CAG5003371.1 hypothetical protein DYBT9275_03137 [Dyadobacter sp. CECT 9275]